ncbi:MAG: MurR/RpiR family transcriptional regulator [Kosmotogaceae bacterium]
MEKATISPTLNKIKNVLPELTATSKKIAEFVLETPDDVLKMSISELANAANVKSESSVVRFYRALGFSGYHDFKVTLAGEMSGSSIVHTYEDVLIDDTVSEVKRKVFSSCIRAFQDNLNSLDEENLYSAVELIEKSRQIICVGHGASASVANYAAFRFSLLGKDAFFIPDSHSYAIVFSKLKKNDMVLAVSYSGETRDIVLPLQRKFEGTNIVSLTGNSYSSLARISKVVLLSNVKETAMRTDAMISRCIQLAIVDVLFSSLAIREGEDSLNTLSDSRKSLAHLKF